MLYCDNSFDCMLLLSEIRTVPSVPPLDIYLLLAASCDFATFRLIVQAGCLQVVRKPSSQLFRSHLRWYMLQPFTASFFEGSIERRKKGMTRKKLRKRAGKKENMRIG